MEEVIRKRLDFLKEKINSSKTRTEYNRYLKEFNELYLDWVKLKK